MSTANIVTTHLFVVILSEYIDKINCAITGSFVAMDSLAVHLVNT